MNKKGDEIMRIVKVRMKRGVIKGINPKQKVYNYICPLKNVEVGDFVLVDVFIHNRDTFGVARIEEIYELSGQEVEENKIFGFCVMKMPDGFNEHCNKIRNIKRKLLSKQDGSYHVKKNKKNAVELK